MGEFRMPSLGADMDAGTVVEWLVGPGDHVTRGEIVAVVDTDKADIDVEIFETGVIGEILVPPGEKVPVGTVLATVHAEGAVPTPPARPTPPAPPAPAIPPATARTRPEQVGTAASPVLRRLAKHFGVDLATVAGTGPDGAVTRADIEAAAGKPLTEPTLPAERADRPAAMREALAQLMSRSKREIPHYYLATDVDFSRPRAWLDETNGARPVTERLLPVTLLLKAVAVAARETPVVNGFFIDGAFVPATEVNVGVAVALPGGGLIAPALARADERSLVELGAALRDLVARTRGGRLRATEMSGPTITVTSLGDQGVDRVFGVIYPPQVAIVGFGRIAERPWVEGGLVGARPVVSLTLSGDHRVSDGHQGGRFLTLIEHLLQEPDQL